MSDTLKETINNKLLAELLRFIQSKNTEIDCLEDETDLLFFMNSFSIDNRITAAEEDRGEWITFKFKIDDYIIEKSGCFIANGDVKDSNDSILDFLYDTTNLEIINSAPEQGLKEMNGKLLTLEVDAEFVQAMMQVMTANKSKYPRFNHYKPIEALSLFEAMERHLLELKVHIQAKIKNNKTVTDYIDETDGNSHLVKIATNAMMLWLQLNNKQ